MKRASGRETFPASLTVAIKGKCFLSYAICMLSGKFMFRFFFQILYRLRCPKRYFECGLFLCRDARIRSAYCREAAKYGFESISPEDRPRRITALVNVYANERNAFENFKTNALPLLNLAGLEVNVIKVRFHHLISEI